ncbi:MAG: hypothetical protein RJB66_390 [Pseudomonadota bacterium]|jgi:hypothetical protein
MTKTTRLVFIIAILLMLGSFIHLKKSNSELAQTISQQSQVGQ